MCVTRIHIFGGMPCQFHADFFRNSCVRQLGIEAVPKGMKGELVELPYSLALNRHRINPCALYDAVEHFGQSVGRVALLL